MTMYGMTTPNTSKHAMYHLWNIDAQSVAQNRGSKLIIVGINHTATKVLLNILGMRQGYFRGIIAATKRS